MVSILPILKNYLIQFKIKYTYNTMVKLEKENVKWQDVGEIEYSKSLG